MQQLKHCEHHGEYRGGGQQGHGPLEAHIPDFQTVAAVGVALGKMANTADGKLEKI